MGEVWLGLLVVARLVFYATYRLVLGRWAWHHLGAAVVYSLVLTWRGLFGGWPRRKQAGVAGDAKRHADTFGLRARTWCSLRILLSFVSSVRLALLQNCVNLPPDAQEVRLNTPIPIDNSSSIPGCNFAGQKQIVQQPDLHVAVELFSIPKSKRCCFIRHRCPNLFHDLFRYLFYHLGQLSFLFGFLFLWCCRHFNLFLRLLFAAFGFTSFTCLFWFEVAILFIPLRHDGFEEVVDYKAFSNAFDNLPGVIG